MLLIIFLFGFGLGYVFFNFWCQLTRPIARKLFKKVGWHLHHSLFIFPALVLAILFSEEASLFFLGIGIAAILHDFWAHNKKLVFISKE